MAAVGVTVVVKPAPLTLMIVVAPTGTRRRITWAFCRSVAPSAKTSSDASLPCSTSAPYVGPVMVPLAGSAASVLERAASCENASANENGGAACASPSVPRAFGRDWVRAPP